MGSRRAASIGETADESSFPENPAVFNSHHEVAYYGADRNFSTETGGVYVSVLVVSILLPHCSAVAGRYNPTGAMTSRSFKPASSYLAAQPTKRSPRPSYTRSSSASSTKSARSTKSDDSFIATLSSLSTAGHAAGKHRDGAGSLASAGGASPPCLTPGKRSIVRSDDGNGVALPRHGRQLLQLLILFVK